MADRLIVVNETTASKLRLYFHLVDTSGINPALLEDGGQPQISVDGAAWTDTGIGVLNEIGHGRYYADLNTSQAITPGTVIETRYFGTSDPQPTAECPGDTAQIIRADIYGYPRVDVWYVNGQEVVDGQPDVNVVSVETSAYPAIADAVLQRDWTLMDTSNTPSRCAWQALRVLRNKWTVGSGTLTVKKEDDSTTAWTGSVSSDAAADPITGVDPA